MAVVGGGTLKPWGGGEALGSQETLPLLTPSAGTDSFSVRGCCFWVSVARELSRRDYALLAVPQASGHSGWLKYRTGNEPCHTGLTVRLSSIVTRSFP